MSTIHLPVTPPAPAQPPSGAARHLLGLASTLGEAAARVRSSADGEAVHDLRVAARRLSAALSTWKSAVAARPGRRARAALRRLRRRLASTREREVMAEQLAELIAGEPLGVRAAGTEELQRLRRLVARGRARAARRAAPRRLARIARRIEACADGLSLTPSALGAARARVETRRAAAMEAVERATAGDDPALHRARIAVKRWHYGADALAHAADEPRAGSLRALRDLQRCLGAIHDAAVLRDHLGRRALRARARGALDRSQALGWLREKAIQTRARALSLLPAAAAGAGAIPPS